MTAERALIQQILARHGARSDLRLFRNSVGLGWFGKLLLIAKEPMRYNLLPGDVLLRGARKMHAGLAVGSADLIGIQHSNHKGCGFGQFVSLEVKTENVVSEPHQLDWGRMVMAFGGSHAEIRSVDDVDALLGPPPKPAR